MNRFATAVSVAALSLAFAAPASAFEVPRCFENPAFVEADGALYIDAGPLFEAAAMTNITTLNLLADAYAEAADTTLGGLVETTGVAKSLEASFGTVAMVKLNDAIHDARKERDSLRDERDQINETRADLRAEILALRDVARDLRAELRGADTSTDVAKLRRQLDKVRREIAALRAERAAATAVRDGISAEIKVMRGALQALRAGRCLVRQG